jgi:hypothetical protein
MKRLVLVVLALGATVGCARRETFGTTTTTGHAAPNNQLAIDNVTLARCNREQACDNLGSGKRYAAFDACTRELGADVAPKLNEQVCARGLDDSDLARCLDDIRNEPCERSLDTIDRLSSCRKGKLCR